MIANTWRKLGLIPRLAISCGAVLAALGFVLIANVVNIEIEQNANDNAARLESDLAMLVSALTGHAILGDYTSVAEFLGAFAQRPGIGRVAWTDPRGHDVGVRGALVDHAAPAWFVALADLPADSGSKRIVVGGTDYGEVSLRLNPVAEVNKIWDQVGADLPVGLVGVAALLGVILITVGRGLRPLAQLISVVSRFGNGDYSVRATVAGTPEIVASIHAFNSMAERVSSVFDSLRESEARNRRLAIIVDQSSEAIITRDLNGTITSWNKGAERLYGWTAAQALGKSGRELHLRGATDAQYARVLARMRTTSTWVSEDNCITQAGALLHVSATRAPLLDESGSVIGDIGIARDITQLKEARRALLQANEQLEARVLERTTQLAQARDASESANRAKSEFLANMSHEIRTPLNGLLGLTDLILDTELSREQRDDLVLVQSSGKSLLSVINDILDFSKIEAGHLQMESIQFSPADGIADMVKALAPQAHEKGIELIYDASGLPPLLLCDPTWLRQIVNNLVGNAIKFTERGEIVVTVSVVIANPQADPQADPQGDTAGAVALQVSVRDSGIGISKEAQDTIFDAFTQADASTTRRYGGTGLGLTISARLARLMDGTISVESVLGQGSHFTFTLSCAVAHNPVPLPADERRSMDGQPVLLVECNDHQRDVLLRWLAGWGMVPAAVADVPSALAALEQAHRAGHPRPLVLLDALSLDRDGAALLERIVHEPHLCAGAVVLSRGAQRGHALRGLALGMWARVSKPIRPSELFDALLAAINPDAAEPAQQAAAPGVRCEAHKGSRILLAEDHETNRVLARRVLQKLGHQVSVAINGLEALDAIKHGAFDLVLMDMQMPVMGGLEAAAAIRSREAGGGTRLPIIALTANAMRGDRESCLAAGMDDYLTKPYSASQMSDMLTRWLPGEITRSAEPQTPKRCEMGRQPVMLTRLNFDILKGYVGDEDEAVDEFLRSYLATSVKAACRLHQAHCERSADAIRTVSHQLKSAARTVGAVELGELCATLEAAGMGNDWAVIDAAMARLDALLAAAAADADAWLSAHTS